MPRMQKIKQEKNECRQRKNKEQINNSKDNNFAHGAKDNIFFSTISNNSVKYLGSKSGTEETSNTINIIPTPNDNNKNMKESAYNAVNKKDKNNIRHASSSQHLQSTSRQNEGCNFWSMLFRVTRFLKTNASAFSLV